MKEDEELEQILYIPVNSNPDAVKQCMKGLMYERKAVCTRDVCSSFYSEELVDTGFGGWQWQTVRTDISESAAAQSCQYAR